MDNRVIKLLIITNDFSLISFVSLLDLSLGEKTSLRRLSKAREASFDFFFFNTVLSGVSPS